MTTVGPARWALVALALPLSCGKVPIYDVEAGFVTAAASWFEEEETLFFFAEVRAEQGLGDPSVIEVTYTTDNGRVPWTPIEDLPTVHTHVPVDCGLKGRCASTSLAVPLQPREVGIRLRYHEDGALALRAGTTLNVVRAGPPHESRSMVVYGVFDETNRRLQWRGRHQFPTLRNERASELGLRRTVAIRETRYGQGDPTGGGNPYGYGVDCPNSFDDTDLATLQFDERAAFHPEAIPEEAWGVPTMCASATVMDATGPFTTTAYSRKNPEVRPAFPELVSPVEPATPISFFLAPCRRTIDEGHAEMQRQRLFLEGLPTTCIDDWQQPGFVDGLVATFRDAIEAERPNGRDMVLNIAVHRDDEGMVEAVEEALAQVVPRERERASPRVAGTFLFDSVERTLRDSVLEQTTLWCPAALLLDDGSLPNLSEQSCVLIPDIPELVLGPISFTALPILPTRQEYNEFLETYSKGQAGEVIQREFLAPEFATTSDTVDFGDFGSITFLNGESIDTEPTHAFSYCTTDQPPVVVFRSDITTHPRFQDLAAAQCESLGLPPSQCDIASAGVLTLDFLPEWHATTGETRYELGLFWDFPFLLRMEYETFAAGAATAFGVSVPFGFRQEAEQVYGSYQWEQEVADLSELLTECTRFCAHPTFDSAGVYHITDPFTPTYLTTCYLPDYPEPGDGGFPIDP